MTTSDHNLNTEAHSDLYSVPKIKKFLGHFNKDLESFVEVLKQEQNTLLKGTADEISVATQNKLSFIQALSTQVASHFNNLSNNVKNSFEESLKMMNLICTEKQIDEWNSSQTLIQYCRELSDENSIILANRLKSTNSALDTLYSLTGSHQNKTYDDNGHSQHSHNSRQLASV